MYVGYQIGLTENDMRHLYWWKMNTLINQWKKHHNMIVKKMVWTIDKE